MKLSLHSFNLPLAHTFKISRAEGVDYAKTLIIELEHQGVSGYGEAGANRYYKNTVEEMVDVLNSHKTKIESMDPNEPENMWDALKDLLDDYSFALCGLDMAAHDLYGKLKNRPLYELWGLDPSNNV